MSIVAALVQYRIAEVWSGGCCRIVVACSASPMTGRWRTHLCA